MTSKYRVALAKVAGRFCRRDPTCGHRCAARLPRLTLSLQRRSGMLQTVVAVASRASVGFARGGSERRPRVRGDSGERDSVCITDTFGC